MGVISTPPSPAALKDSSSEVIPAASTAFPIHHHRVHGLVSRAGVGQPVRRAGWCCVVCDPADGAGVRAKVEPYSPQPHTTMASERDRRPDVLERVPIMWPSS